MSMIYKLLISPKLMCMISHHARLRHLFIVIMRGLIEIISAIESSWHIILYFLVTVVSIATKYQILEHQSFRSPTKIAHDYFAGSICVSSTSADIRIRIFTDLFHNRAGALSIMTFFSFIVRTQRNGK